MDRIFSGLTLRIFWKTVLGAMMVPVFFDEKRTPPFSSGSNIRFFSFGVFGLFRNNPCGKSFMPLELNI
jgi:hypothetical protein